MAAHGPTAEREPKAALRLTADHGAGKDRAAAAAGDLRLDSPELGSGNWIVGESSN